MRKILLEIKHQAFKHPHAGAAKHSPVMTGGLFQSVYGSGLVGISGQRLP